MAELGFFGLTIPEEYGGLGGDYVTYALAMEELGRADSALRGIVSVSSGLVGKSILFHGTEEQKQEWLPAAGDRDASWAASASPSPTPAPTPATSPAGPCATAPTG